MKTIEKKIKDLYFQSIKRGTKKYEFRLADFSLGSYDKLILVNEKTKEEIKFNIKDFRYILGQDLQENGIAKNGYIHLIETLMEFYDKVDIFKFGAYIIEIPDKEEFL